MFSMKSKGIGINDCLLFLIGVFLGTNIFLIGNFSLLFFIEIVYIFYNLFFVRKRLSFRHIPVCTFPLLVLIVASLGMSLLSSGNLGLEMWMKGIGVLVTNYFFILILSNSSRPTRGLVNGLIVSLFLSTLLSLISFGFFLRGITFSLDDYISNVEIFKPNEYTFRATGLFSEPGIMLIFLTNIHIFLHYHLLKRGRQISALFVDACVIALVVLSRSGSFLIFVATWALYFLSRPKVGYEKKVKKRIFTFMLIGGLGLFAFFYSDIIAFFQNVFDSIFEMVSDISVNNGESNTFRFESILLGFKEILNNPFGCGYNCGASYYFDIYGHYLYSSLLQMFLDLGFFGVIYVVLYIEIIIKLLRTKSEFSKVLIASLLGSLMIKATTVDRLSLSYVLVAFSLIEINRRKPSSRKVCIERIGDSSYDRLIDLHPNLQ